MTLAPELTHHRDLTSNSRRPDPAEYSALSCLVGCLEELDCSDVKFEVGRGLGGVRFTADNIYHTIYARSGDVRWAGTVSLDGPWGDRHAHVTVAGSLALAQDLAAAHYRLEACIKILDQVSEQGYCDNSDHGVLQAFHTALRRRASIAQEGAP